MLKQLLPVKLGKKQYINLYILFILFVLWPCLVKTEMQATEKHLNLLKNTRHLCPTTNNIYSRCWSMLSQLLKFTERTFGSHAYEHITY